jgi:hypothetical protein
MALAITTEWNDERGILSFVRAAPCCSGESTRRLLRLIPPRLIHTDETGRRQLL